MAKPPRYLWGITKVKYLQFAPAIAPDKKAGRMYFDSTTNTFRFCQDGANFVPLSSSSSSSSSKSSSSSSKSSSSSSSA